MTVTVPTIPVRVARTRSGTFPRVSNRRVTVQALVLGVAGYVNEPSSNLTLWLPPPFVQVTVSPWLIVTAAGENVSEEVAATVSFAA